MKYYSIELRTRRDRLIYTGDGFTDDLTRDVFTFETREEAERTLIDELSKTSIVYDGYLVESNSDDDIKLIETFCGNGQL